MCIIVDANTFSRVFNQKSVDHQDFKPVLDWVLDGRGVFIYGGTRYLEELGVGKYLDLFVELTIFRKAKRIDHSAVDDRAAWATAIIDNEDFDDPHLVGLLLVSGCKLICSLDERAYPYFTHQKFFSPASRRPKIYRRSTNANLLCEANMADICKPGKKLTVAEKAKITLLK